MSWNDASAEGFDDGYEDGYAGRSKNYRKIPKLKSMVSSNAQESYTSSYDEGYRKGAYDRKSEK